MCNYHRTQHLSQRHKDLRFIQKYVHNEQLYLYSQKLETKYPSAGGWLNKLWSSHSWATTQQYKGMNYGQCNNLDESIENMLSEKSQSQKATHGYHSICITFLEQQNYWLWRLKKEMRVGGKELRLSWQQEAFLQWRIFTNINVLVTLYCILVV